MEKIRLVRQGNSWVAYFNDDPQGIPTAFTHNASAAMVYENIKRLNPHAEIRVIVD